MIFILLLIILDQITKYFLTTTVNYGAAFNILIGYTTLLIIISLIALTACLYYYIKSKEKYLKLGLSFLIAGIVGNLFDRIFLGYVRDFIDFNIFPVFNLADTFNFVGVLIIIYLSFKK